MAEITCAYSGLVFHCDFMPTSLSSREYHHPLFSVPKKKLIALSGEWARGKLAPPESYLLYLSLFNSTDLIQWQQPARFIGQKTLQIIANNMESLVQIIGKIDLIQHPAFVLPKFVITYDTSDLTNSYHWIQAWNSNYNDFIHDQKDARIREEIKQRVETRESALQRLIKSEITRPINLANVLANWAEDAGNFPDYLTPHPLLKGNKKVELSEYWKEIIRACVNEEKIWQYPESDIVELLEHCEDNIEHGTIYAHHLMRLLRTGLKKRSDYTGFGDIDLAGKKTSFTLLSEDTSAEAANKIAIIQSAPDKEPKRSEYPSNFAFIRAKLNWDLKQRYRKPDADSGESK
jgi:hypothetical protein